MCQQKKFPNLLAITFGLIILTAFWVVPGARADGPPLPPGSFQINFENLVVPSSPVTNTNLMVIATTGANVTESFNSIVDGTGTSSIVLKQGSWTIISEVENYSFPGKTLVSITHLDVSNSTNITLYYQKVGSLKLTVTDSQGNQVTGAQIQGSCINELYSVSDLNGQIYTDAAGVALIKRVPVGDCVFSATTDSQAGSKTEAIYYGQFIQDNLTLHSVRSELPWVYIGLGVIVLVLVGIMLFLSRSRRPSQSEPDTGKEKRKTEPKPVQVTKSSEFEAVYRTLSESEKKVVDLLMSESKPVKQSKIFATLLIPKTSLIRTINTLQTKGLIKAVPVGNTRLVQLESWLKKS